MPMFLNIDSDDVSSAVQGVVKLLRAGCFRIEIETSGNLELYIYRLEVFHPLERGFDNLVVIKVTSFSIFTLHLNVSKHRRSLLIEVLKIVI